MIVPCLLSAKTSGSPPASCVSTNTGLSNPIAGPSAAAAAGTNTPKTANRLAATMLKRMAPTPLPRDGTPACPECPSGRAGFRGFGLEPGLQPQHGLRVQLRHARLGDAEYLADLAQGQVLVVVERH